MQITVISAMTIIGYIQKWRCYIVYEEIFELQNYKHWMKTNRSRKIIQ